MSNFICDGFRGKFVKKIIFDLDPHFFSWYYNVFGYVVQILYVTSCNPTPSFRHAWGGFWQVLPSPEQWRQCRGRGLSPGGQFLSCHSAITHSGLSLQELPGGVLHGNQHVSECQCHTQGPRSAWQVLAHSTGEAVTYVHMWFRNYYIIKKHFSSGLLPISGRFF